MGVRRYFLRILIFSGVFGLGFTVVRCTTPMARLVRGIYVGMVSALSNACCSRLTRDFSLGLSVQDYSVIVLDFLFWVETESWPFLQESFLYSSPIITVQTRKRNRWSFFLGCQRVVVAVLCSPALTHVSYWLLPAHCAHAFPLLYVFFLLALLRVSM